MSGSNHQKRSNTMIQWHLETRQIKDLKPHPKNPRQLNKDQARHLKESIDKFGLAEKIIINTDNTIIGGHQRINILKAQKVKEVECWVPDRELNSYEAEEFCIRLNKNHGEFDFDILANQFEITDLVNWGFNVDELDIGDFEEIKEEKPTEKPKKLCMCPQCGYEFEEKKA